MPERRQVLIEATCVAILVGYEAVKRDGHADDYFWRWGLLGRLWRGAIRGLSPKLVAAYDAEKAVGRAAIRGSRTAKSACLPHAGLRNGGHVTAGVAKV